MIKDIGNNKINSKVNHHNNENNMHHDNDRRITYIAGSNDNKLFPKKTIKDSDSIIKDLISITYPRSNTQFISGKKIGLKSCKPPTSTKTIYRTLTTMLMIITIILEEAPMILIA